MIKVSLKDRINNFMHKNYDIEYKNRELTIRSYVRVKDLIRIRAFLKSNGINYKNIIIKGDSRCSSYIPI